MSSMTTGYNNMTELENALMKVKGSLNETGYWDGKLGQTKQHKKTYDTLLKNPVFADLQVCTNENNVLVHKFVFCQYPYFHQLIQDKILLNINCSSVVWEDLMSFFYGFGLQMKQSTLLETYNLAEKHQFTDVLQYISQHVKNTFFNDAFNVDLYIDVESSGRKRTGRRFVESPLKSAILHNFAKFGEKYMLNDNFLEKFANLDADFKMELVTGFVQSDSSCIENRFKSILKDARNHGDCTIVTTDHKEFLVNKALIVLESPQLYNTLKNVTDRFEIDLDSSAMKVLLRFFYNEISDTAITLEIIDQIHLKTGIDLNKYYLD
jgi:hypothetical protein